MSKDQLEKSNRYINDLRRTDYQNRQVRNLRVNLLPYSIAAIFLVIAGIYGNMSLSVANDEVVMLIAAATIGGYMALNIGANDVANNMGPAVGGKVLTVGAAVVIAAICESAGALLAGGDVVKTVAKGIVTHGEDVSAEDFRLLMLSALLAAALWINLATYLNAPVSTTHSIVGGVMGAGVAAAGAASVNWLTMSQIAASWVISPVLGGMIAAGLLFFVKRKVIYVRDRKSAAQKWVPLLIAMMTGTFVAYMALKGLSKIWRPTHVEVFVYSVLGFALSWAFSRPWVKARAKGLGKKKRDVHKLFHLPLIIGVALLCFAHGANDVANAVGPLAAVMSTLGHKAGSASNVAIPLWVMVIGAFGISLGLVLFGPKLINTVGAQITRLNAARAYCVAFASATTVLIATTLGLPVSSTHIAIGAVFGVGFLREFLENPNKRRLRPGHKLNATAQDAFKGINIRLRRKLVRRRFALSIAAAWVITVPASAFVAALLFFGLRILVSTT